MGAKRAGGEGNGSVTSVVEVVVPMDEIEWGVSVDIDQEAEFSGTTHVVLENVTESITISAVSGSGESRMTLRGMDGDLLRLTFQAEGRGNAPAGIPAIRNYTVEVSSAFIVPEPVGVTLVAIGAIVVLRRRS
jgi:hypothetical protein